MTPALTSRERRLAYIAWVVVCVVWGTTYLGIRVALETVPVALLAGLRWATAGVILAALLPLFGEKLPPLRTWGSIAVAGFLMAVVGNGGVVWAEQYVASGLAAVVVAMVPFWTVMVEALLPRGERLTPRTLIGLAIGFLGIVVLVWPELTIGGADGRQFVLGVVALQIACLGWAVGTSYTKRHSLKASPLGASAMQMILSGAMLLAIATATGEWSRLSFTPRTAGAMVYLVLVGSIVGYSAYVYALKHLAVSTVSLYAYVNPIIAVILGTLILAEPFSPRIVVAAALVFAGIGVVRAGATGASGATGATGAVRCTGAGASGAVRGTGAGGAVQGTGAGASGAVQGTGAGASGAVRPAGAVRGTGAGASGAVPGASGAVPGASGAAGGAPRGSSAVRAAAGASRTTDAAAPSAAARRVS
jgi:drug/metabolite transporter (DMT)-like permease